MSHQVGSGAGRGDVGAVGRLVCRLLLGHGPLKRGSDRVEALSRLLLCLLLLAAIPLALAAGTAARGEAAELAAHQRADRHQVTAVLVVDTAGVTLGNAGDRQWTLARWTAPDGTVRTGQVPVPVGAAAGEPVAVWVDDAGRLVPPPLTGSEVTDRGVVRGLLVFLVLVGGAGGLHLVLVLALDRQRARRWDRGWAEVEPGWAGRHPTS